MTTRRNTLRLFTAAFVALAVMAVPAIAAELFGVLTKVDVDNKKVTVVEKGTDKSVEVTVTDKTEWVTRKGSEKLDLEKLATQLERIEEKTGRKGVPVVVTHEDAVASKIEMKFMTKKGERRKDDPSR